MNPNLNIVESQEQPVKRGVFGSSDLLAGEPYSPPDMDWNAGAACGHGALAAALGITVADARKYLPKPGWINVPMMKSAIEVSGHKWKRVAKPDPDTTAVILIQFLGPWMRSPIAACQHRHWVATKRGLIWDANTKRWESQSEWKRILPNLIPANSTGFSVWGALVIEEPKRANMKPANDQAHTRRANPKE